ncbi:MAG: Rieske 2Fe-2S domain-containing protein [Dongiaceae bacterium]
MRPESAEDPRHGEAAPSDVPQRGPFSGYYGTAIPDEDRELTHVLPGTPGGEYLRRFWQPVALAAHLSDVPLVVRILGEDLVLFRDLRGRLGLLHRHCVHRRASLEYGRIEESGIRCCYHGWLFGRDGRVLETPGEPDSSTIRGRLWQGAYPTREFGGLVFAYLGPPATVPDFPVIDNFLIPGSTIVPYAHAYPSNWLQVAENSFDSTHVAFLHTRHGKAQFSPLLGAVPTLRFYRRPIGLYHAQARRVGENVWVSSKDILLPNVTQAGAVFSVADNQPRYFGRSTFTRWVVPHDNVRSTVFGVAHFNPRSDPYRPEYATRESLEVLEAGTPAVRPYAEQQRNPGDLEAIGSQGPIAIHAKEHLASTDEGVALYRRQLRRAIRQLAAGTEPPSQTAEGNNPVRTYGGSTILRIARRPETTTPAFLKALSDEVMALYVAGDQVEPERRDDSIRQALEALERHYDVA